jgi:hypothetical protein
MSLNRVEDFFVADVGPIHQKAQPAAAVRTRKTVEAVNKEARAQVRASSLSIPRRTAAVIALDRRTWDRAIGAEYATVASEGFKPHPAAQAVIEELAGIGWHCLDGLTAA